MNHSLWELSIYNRHRHDELLAERQTCAAVSLLPARSTLSAFRRTLGLRLIAAGRVLAGADAMRDAHLPMRPAV